MTIVARLLIALLVAAGAPQPRSASQNHLYAHVTLAQQPTPQPEGGETGGSSAALRLLVVLLCGVGLSSVSLGVAIAFKRRMSAISPDDPDE